MYILIKA